MNAENLKELKSLLEEQRDALVKSAPWDKGAIAKLSSWSELRCTAGSQQTR